MEREQPAGIGNVSSLPPLFAGLLKTLPPTFGRTEIPKLFPGVISRGYLQNLDSDDKGPEKARIGRKVIYSRELFVWWLFQRSTVEAER